MEALGEDMGPLPVWGWIIVAVAGVFLYRRMVGKGGLQAATSPVATLPAYPAGADAGTIINDYRTGAGAGPSTGTTVPAGAIAPTQSTASGWGPTYPDKATGVVPDRPCPPGTFAETSFSQNWWSCATYGQITSLLGYLGTLPAGSVNPADHPTTAPGGATTTTCPAGYQLVSAGTGLTCVPIAAKASGSQ